MLCGRGIRTLYLWRWLGGIPILAGPNAYSNSSFSKVQSLILTAVELDDVKLVESSWNKYSYTIFCFLPAWMAFSPSNLRSASDDPDTNCPAYDDGFDQLLLLLLYLVVLVGVVLLPAKDGTTTSGTSFPARPTLMVDAPISQIISVMSNKPFVIVIVVVCLCFVVCVVGLLLFRYGVPAWVFLIGIVIVVFASFVSLLCVCVCVCSGDRSKSSLAGGRGNEMMVFFFRRFTPRLSSKQASKQANKQVNIDNEIQNDKEG